MFLEAGSTFREIQGMGITSALVFDNGSNFYQQAREHSDAIGTYRQTDILESQFVFGAKGEYLLHPF